MDNQRNREVVCIQGGQAGVQLGHAMWELLTVEHNLNSSGLTNNIYDTDLSFLTFFSQTADNQCFPRSIIFDTEPTVIDEIRCGYYRKLFHPDFLINGNEDSANNFARGYYSESKLMMPIVVERIRNMIEHCDNFQGFLVQSSTAGGTGSGLLTALMEYIVIEFAGRTSVQLSIYPGTRLSNCIVQPYNCLLTQEKLVYSADLNIIVDNEELYNICSNQLDIRRPSFSNINRLISPILSGLTAPIRFKGMLNSDLVDISTNRIPFPRLHFPFVSYSPLMSNDKSDHDFINTASLTRSMFLRENQFINADLQNGYFMSSAILYRGNCDLSNILKTIQDIKTDKNLHWVDWCPTGFKISHTLQMPVSIPHHGPIDYDKSAMMISNHNAIIPTFRSQEAQFRILLKRKAYLHWYIGEGMEEKEFNHALYEVETISDDYLHIVDHLDNESVYVTSASLSRSQGVDNKRYDDSDKGIDRIRTKSENSKRSEEQLVSINLSEGSYHNRNKPLIINKNNSIKGNSFSYAYIADQHTMDTQRLSNNSVKYGCNAFEDVGISKINAVTLKCKNVETFNDNNVASCRYYNVSPDIDAINTSDKSVSKMYSTLNPFSAAGQSFQSHKISFKSFSNQSDSINKHSAFGPNKVTDEIFEICERNYIQKNFKTFNKKRILKQSDVIQQNRTKNHFLKKIYLKNKSILQKLMHIEQYDLVKSTIS